MTLLRALLTGAQQGLGSLRLAVGLWLMSLVVALPAAIVLGVALGDSFGGSLVERKMTSGFDMNWFGEFKAMARGLETTFSPSLVGIGGFLQNLEAWVTGGMFRGFSGVVGLGVVYGLLWALIMGGVLVRYARPGDKRGAAAFIQAGARYFFRFARLAILSAPLYFLIYRMHGKLYASLEDLTRDVTTEGAVLFYSLLVILLTTFLLILVHVCFMYAKIATVVEERRSMIVAALRGAGFVITNPGKTLGLYYAVALIGILLTLIFMPFAPGPDQATFRGVTIAFFAVQFFLILRMILRLTLYAAQVSLYTGLRGEAVPVER